MVYANKASGRKNVAPKLFMMANLSIVSAYTTHMGLSAEEKDASWDSFIILHSGIPKQDIHLNWKKKLWYAFVDLEKSFELPSVVVIGVEDARCG